MNLLHTLAKLLGAKPSAEFQRVVAELQSVEDQSSLTKRDLISALQALAQREPRTKEELVRVEAESFVLGERIKKNPALHDIPHDIWHFLSDADIRFKDSRYRAAQLEGLARWIREI